MTESTADASARQVYLGIDNGTQGLSIVAVDATSMQVIATGEGGYDVVPDLEVGCYEQRTEDWQVAMVDAMDQVRRTVPNLRVLAIGISGQMHGEVLMDETGSVLAPVRLWCDARNEEEGRELTGILRHKVPKRMTSARFLWTVRNQRDVAERTRHMTTPAGWLGYLLTGQHTLGIGDASGMFPICQQTMDYDADLLELYDATVRATTTDGGIASLATLLPRVCRAGEPAGYLSAEGAQLLGLPEGIPVAPPEGDQPAALAGSLIGRAGTVSCCFGTSVCANSVGDRPFEGVSDAVDHFCAADGKPINMVWLRNGTTFLNTVVGSYGSLSAKEEPFAAVMPLVVRAPPDCGGLLALPFMADEPGLQVSRGGSAMIVGWSESNGTPGNVAKAALLSTCFNLKKGSEILDEQGFPRTELVFSGGLAKTPECGQILADVFDTPVQLLTSSDEGSSYGAGLMAAFLHQTLDGPLNQDWASFLESLRSLGSAAARYEPIPANVVAVDAMYQRYKKLLELVRPITEAISP